jgi:hypothetical protein
MQLEHVWTYPTDMYLNPTVRLVSIRNHRK